MYLSRNATRLCSLIPLLLLISKANAFHEGVVAAFASQASINANPPLPLLYLKKDSWKGAVQPGYFTGSLGSSNNSNGSYGGSSSGGTSTGDFHGFAGAMAYSKSFADKWGYYGWVEGTIMNGDFVTGSGGSDNFCSSYSNQSSCPVSQLELRGVKANLETVSVGIVYQILGEVTGGYSLEVFTGPAYNRAVASQNVFKAGYEDFDMKVTSSELTLMFGIQGAIPIKKSFIFNPFVLANFPSGLGSNECKPYTITAKRKDTVLGAETALKCSSKGGEIDIGQGFLAAGLNLNYIPWDVTFSLTAPFGLGDIDNGRGGDDNTKYSVTNLSVTWSFGDFVK